MSSDRLHQLVFKLRHCGLDTFLSRSRLGLEGSRSRSRLGREDITSRSRSRDFSLVNMHAMRIYHEENNGSDPQEIGCQVTDFTSWCLNCDTAVSIRFLERLVLVSVLKIDRLARLGLVT